MKSLDAKRQIQGILGVVQDGSIGTKTLNALQRLVSTPDNADWPPVIIPGSPGWPFTIRVDCDDIVCENIFITCFGGAYDPQDDGQTASGVNTKSKPTIEGVSVAMNGLQFDHLTPKEHAALDGAPLPRLPWHTLVQVTIGSKTYTPPEGIIDLGPGLGASKPGEPHALDLTVMAAARFEPNTALERLSRTFKMMGSFRVLGGAKYLLRA